MTQFKDTSEAAVSAIRTILRLCELSGTVRRVIYTGSVTAASPLKEDDTGFKDSIDESCWTPLNLSYDRFGDFLKVSLSLSLSLISHLSSLSLRCGAIGLSYVEDAVRERITDGERESRARTRGGEPNVRLGRRRCDSTIHTTDRGSNGVAGDRQEVAARGSEVSASSAGISTTRTHRGCLRSSCVLHGEGVNVRQISVCRRLPNNARHRRSLRREVSSTSHTDPRVSFCFSSSSSFFVGIELIGFTGGWFQGGRGGDKDSMQFY